MRILHDYAGIPVRLTEERLKHILEHFFRETANDQVMEKVDAIGNILGFSIFKVSALSEKPLEVSLN